MTLTTKANGLYDCYTLRDDIKAAIESNDYRTLQTALKDFRDIHYYEGSLRIVKQAMLDVATGLLAELNNEIAECEAHQAARTANLQEASDKTEDQILFHQIFLKSAPVNDTARLWADNHDKGAIVMVHEYHRTGANGNYVTYGSHARFLGRAVGREVELINGVSRVAIPHCLFWHDQSRMRNEYRVEVVLIDPREQATAA